MAAAKKRKPRTAKKVVPPPKRVVPSTRSNNKRTSPPSDDHEPGQDAQVDSDSDNDSDEDVAAELGVLSKRQRSHSTSSNKNTRSRDRVESEDQREKENQEGDREVQEREEDVEFGQEDGWAKPPPPRKTDSGKGAKKGRGKGNGKGKAKDRSLEPQVDEENSKNSSSSEPGGTRNDNNNNDDDEEEEEATTGERTGNLQPSQDERAESEVENEQRETQAGTGTNLFNRASQEEEEGGEDADIEEQASPAAGEEDDEEEPTDPFALPHGGPGAELRSRKKVLKKKALAAKGKAVGSKGKKTTRKGKGKGKEKEVVEETEPSDEQETRQSQQRQPADPEEEEEEEESPQNSNPEGAPAPVEERAKRTKPLKRPRSNRRTSGDSFQPSDNQEDSQSQSSTSQKKQKEQVEKGRKKQKQMFNFPEPNEDPNRPSNPERSYSFTHWNARQEKFVPDRIWLHSDAQSWRTDDTDNDDVDNFISRERVERIIEENGGKVYGPEMEEMTWETAGGKMRKCDIVVTPDWYSPSFKEIYEQAETLEIEMVTRKWIFRSTLYQEDGLDPSYRCLPYDSAFAPPSLKTKPKKLATRPGALASNNVTESGLVYNIKEEEERYWFKLARRVETGRNRMSKSEMTYPNSRRAHRMQYRRNRLEYSRLYSKFLDRMLQRKKLKERAPRNKEERKRLKEMKLFTSDEEGDAEMEGEGGEGDGEMDPAFVASDHGDDQPPREPSSNRRKSDLFDKRKKSKAQMEREAREAEEEAARERGMDEDDVDQGSSFQRDQESEAQDSLEQDIPSDVCQLLAAEYSRPLEQVEGVFFYSNLSRRRARTVLELLANAEAETDPRRFKALLKDARENLFTEELDDELLGQVDDERELLQILGRRDGWTDRQLLDRLAVLQLEGAPWVDEDVRRRFWFPNEENL
ncbi:uncharacterized protein JCM6883_004963 [Sporobolomyces salmoneus]|uniref:uncharacterized protein n=1 Tax=Sporobolomyces salmoneus TaxID=183962 RepID=UPI00318163CB